MHINLPPHHFPQLLLRYNKEQIIEIALRMAAQDGIANPTAEQLGSRLAILESDLEFMFQRSTEGDEAEE